MCQYLKAEFLSAEGYFLLKCDDQVLHVRFCDCTFRLSGCIRNSLLCKQSLQQICMQIRHETGHLSWLEFSF